MFTDNDELLLFTDINECIEGTDECDTNAACINIDGSYTCDCNDGYGGDGFTCEGKTSSKR